MAVYVDDMLRWATVGRLRARWSHLVADSRDELDSFARRLGLKPTYRQHNGRPTEHYDLTESKRRQAIALGAVQVTYPSGMAEVIERKQLAHELQEIQVFISPDCRVGKCTACTGDAWDDAKDAVTECQHHCHSQGELF